MDLSTTGNSCVRTEGLTQQTESGSGQLLDEPIFSTTAKRVFNTCPCPESHAEYRLWAPQRHLISGE